MSDEPRIVSMRGNAYASSTASGIAESRYSFTAQFLHGGAILTRRAHDIESIPAASLSEELHAEHRALIVGAIVQSAAPLESEIYEVARFGPGCHLGSNGVDAAAREFLSPMADVIDGEPTLRRYDLVLHLLRRPALDRAAHSYQAACLLVRLRNEIIHYKYKSKWGAEMKEERPKLIKQLEQLRFEKPGFISPHANFFPHRCLSASLASWSVATTVAFINCFYDALAITSPLVPYAARLTVPEPRLQT